MWGISAATFVKCAQICKKTKIFNKYFKKIHLLWYGKSRNESAGCMHYKERERKSTALFRWKSFIWNFPCGRFHAAALSWFRSGGDQLLRLELEVVDDDGVLLNSLNWSRLELVTVECGGVRPLGRRSPLAWDSAPLRLSSWYCSVDRHTERTHAASHSRPVFDVFNGFPPDPDVKLWLKTW